MLTLKQEMPLIKRFVTAFVNGYSEIFLLKNPIAGLVILLTTLCDQGVGLSGIISVLAAFLFSRFIKFDQYFLDYGHYVYNPLFVGLGVGYIYKLSFLSVILACCAGILTFLITIALANVLFYYFKLPVLSIPFVIVGSLIYLSSLPFYKLYGTGFALHDGILSATVLLPLWLAGFFKALGAILFLPYVIPGIILALVLFFSSRIIFFLALLGYYTGTIFMGLLTGSFEYAFQDTFYFNFILISIALGGIFIIPSVRSYILAFLAVFISVFLVKGIEVLFSIFVIPGLTLPFNLVTLIFLYALKVIYYPDLTTAFKNIPEETLNYYLSNIKRYSGSINCISLPFGGRWTVWQGFHGKWTHIDSMQYAYDFIITDEENKSFQNSGQDLGDYYAYKKVIIAPISGKVIKVVNHLQDNPIGHSDIDHLWGNYVIIKDDRGFFIKISHFLRDSITVCEDQWIEKGAILGRCGNSGNSPQPHIHIQAQTTAESSAYTIPFSFINYLTENTLNTNSIPAENQVIEPLTFNKQFDLLTSLSLDEIYSFKVNRDKKNIGIFAVQVKVAGDGTFYLLSKNARLYFGKNNETFFCYSIEGNNKHLQNLFMALPKLPLGYKQNIFWKDYIPLRVVLGGVSKEVMSFISSFHPQWATIEAEYSFISQKIIQGQLQIPFTKGVRKTSVEFSDKKWIKSFVVGKYHYELIEPETNSN